MRKNMHPVFAAASCDDKRRRELRRRVDVIYACDNRKRDADRNEEMSNKVHNEEKSEQMAIGSETSCVNCYGKIKEPDQEHHVDADPPSSLNGSAGQRKAQPDCKG